VPLTPGGCAGQSRGTNEPNEVNEGEINELLRVQLLQRELVSSKAADVLSAGSAATSLATSTTAAATTTVPPTGMTLNAAGDFNSFISALATNAGFTIFCVFVFGWLRLRYPIMYNNNVIEGFAPGKPEETFWGWFRPTMAVTIEEVSQSITLDHAMLLEYTHFCMKTLAFIGLPMMCIMGPVNWIFGGDAAGQDRLSYLSFGNIQLKSNLFWVHAFVVWYVVLVVTFMTHSAMRQFLEKRKRWLYQMSEQRANTVLVESIPDEFQSEEKLRGFLQKALPGASVRSVYIAKDTDQLQALIAKRDNAKYYLREAEAKLAKDPGAAPMVRDGYMGGQVEAIPYWRRQAEEVEPQVKAERGRVQEESRNVGGVNTSSGFVTFEERSSAEILLRLDGCLAADEDQWEMYHAPQPSDILWADLTQDDSAQAVRTAIGYLLVVGLYFLYMPAVIGITNIANLVDFSKFGLAPVQPFWQAFAPTIGLQIMVAFLPTFLILIFKAFFTCRAEAWQQHKLQIWYFWFQVVFVLLATAVGQNVRKFTSTLFGDPTSIFKVLAETMPYATHFYMNFLVLQWMSHSMNFTRYFPLFKYKAALGLYDEKEAKAFAEPEDQDYYGMGSRSARWSIAMAICIVFGTLCPPINVLGFLTFLLCRMIYGYLFCFAEIRKADTGGAFWVTQLQHVFVSTILYCVLMIGVLAMRAENYGPALIALPSLIWTAGSLFKFNRYSWDKLPIQDLVLGDDLPAKGADSGKYVQPEMMES